MPRKTSPKPKKSARKPMKRVHPICLCLVGWEDERMTHPKRCGHRASHVLVSHRLPACPEHVRWNKKKDLTYAPKNGPMIGAGRGSFYQKL